MNRVLVLLTAVLLSACVGGGRNLAPAVVYDFGLPAARLVADGSWSRLAIEVRSPLWFDSSNVNYRLAYEEPLTRREYVSSRWAGTPGGLIAQRLRQQLGAVSATENVATDCLLRVELQEFSQVFDSPQSSRGVLLGSVSLIGQQRQLIAERLVSIEKPSATADAHGGVKALVAASAELGPLLADWLAELKNNNDLKVCRPV